MSRAPARPLPRLFLILLVGACARGSEEREPSPASRPAPGPAAQAAAPIPHPEPDLQEPRVAAQLREARARLERALKEPPAPGDPERERGAAYGALGMLYHAYRFLEAARGCYAEAAQRAPEEARWAYYLARAREELGESADAVESYERVLALEPRDLATLLRLGELHLSRSEPERALGYFERALAEAPDSAAALFGIGRTAAAAGRPEEAVRRFEQALALEPEASALRYSLAMAYRDLGDPARAAAELARHGTTSVRVPDPRLAAVQALVEGAVSHLKQGGTALQAGRLREAAEAFEKAAEADPQSAVARLNLGVALARLGEPAAALAALEAAERLEPQSSAVSLTLATLLAGSGRDREAAERYRRAASLDPRSAEAHFLLADTLLRLGRFEEAERHYEAAAAIDPGLGVAQIRQAASLARRGRFADARLKLERALERRPDDLAIASALARLYAAAPEAALRDAARARELAARAFQASRSLELAEAMAMALAESGDTREAARLQRGLVELAERSGKTALAKRLRPSLERYERGLACREPWAADDPQLNPRPPGSAP